ncbi:sensor histidine kinase [Devosia rhizoryzae]|uniref:histidine kinase n=1 Tax=Devosia rhizoryzae TaxID=2774137 RepID=A0ABX7C6I2_9HYPH|nr:HAMP domain-containing sensor histidine kinase [Devosia rhizoryzae]QQR38245.1 hypothetical protein JI748_10665 [Devosia rhizoryzae]
MNERWSTLPDARRVLPLAEDARPAWLWSQDGQRLIWSNRAAELFAAKIKKGALKLAPAAVPIKGQINRIMRLGTTGRSSLARIQFLTGERPVSATCSTTPLVWEESEPVLLITAVDPIADDILALARGEAEPELVQPIEEPVRDEPAPDAAYEHELESWRDADAETVYEPAPAMEPDPEADAPEQWSAALAEDEPVAPVIEPVEPVVAAVEDSQGSNRLSSLIDRLAADDALFSPLTEADDVAPALATEVPEPAPLLFKVTGRGFTPNVVESAEPVVEEAAVPPPPDAETVERVSRYNFDELSRILSDRVGNQPPATTKTETSTPGALINLGGETLVLNRLPLGILVFRDQQILFANRAITEMVGYESVESLRKAGLAAMFPSAGGDDQSAGPVNHLVQRDGTLVPVTARLQSISWQGRPALMLSASTTEVRTGHEDAVKAFAQSFADIRGDGFIDANRAGVVNFGSEQAANLLAGGKVLAGRPIADLVGSADVVALRAFLERPARFAETARPCLTLRSADGRSEILLFALGQAGVLSGYFGLVRGREAAPARISAASDVDPALLGRISRGVRRPLNTIVGFSDLIRSKAFGALNNERYEGYADDIARAAQEIAALVDELDDYARLRDGRYLPQRASLDLTALLESCVLRIRDQANANRVIVRNAISETLPRITADRASLAQAVLNLLASAIDQTPVGGAVVISAQRHDDGAIVIQVRDSSAGAVDMSERFVVFRDGVGRDGQALAPVRSSVGLALTRSLLAVNTVSLSVDPAGAEGLLFSLKIPADLVDERSAVRDN